MLGVLYNTQAPVQERFSDMDPCCNSLERNVIIIEVQKPSQLQRMTEYKYMVVPTHGDYHGWVH